MDIVERLKQGLVLYSAVLENPDKHMKLFDDAANEITRLCAENEALRKDAEKNNSTLITRLKMLNVCSEIKKIETMSGVCQTWAINSVIDKIKGVLNEDKAIDKAGESE